LAPPVETSNWFKLENVILGNGPHFGGTGGDEVGVIVSWGWRDAMAGVTDADFEKVAPAIKGGKWRQNSQATDWVGRAVVKALDVDLDDKMERARISTMLKAWMTAGLLVVVDDLDNNHMSKKFAEVAEVD
jgi:hypothetical protein